MVNDCMCLALVDTGSVVSIVKKTWVEGMGLRYSQMRDLPRLTGITQNILPDLGSVYLEVYTGSKVVRHLFRVVPDGFLDTDLLLGADLLRSATFTWDSRRRVIIWAGVTYPVRLLKPRPSNKRVRRIQTTGPSPGNVKPLNLKERLIVPQYTTGVYAIPIDEPPDSLLEFTASISQIKPGASLCLKVTDSREIYVPFVNDTKVRLTMGIGTKVGTYRRIHEQDIDPYVPKCRKVRIKNSLVPDSVDIKHEGSSREEKLQYLISHQDVSHLSAEQQEQLRDMLVGHHSIFILEETELGKFKDVQAHIQVSDPTPVRSPNYRYPEKAKEVIAKMLEEMEAKGIIETSTAAWLSPIVLVSKPDNSKRMCLDYRRVNTHLQVDIHPLPLLEEMVESAAGNCYYASLDMKDAYYQVELDEESRDLTTFSDGVSLYRFKRLPFGLSCSPAIFSRVMGTILAPLLKLGWVKNYLDDIVVWAPSFPALLKRLDQLFKLFSDKGVKLNVNKCQFGQKEIKFLGHIISQEGCRPCPDNVAAIHDMKSPTNVKEVRRFLGMCGFYRKHIQAYAKIAVPLTNLLRKKESFLWTKECQSSFEQLKQALTTAPVLVKAQMSRPFELFTDASLNHVGAVLMQRDEGRLKPIGYFSKKLKPVEQRYSTTDREALGVILACRRFHHFLWGVPFTIHTDHQPLVSVFKRKTKSPRMSRWVIEMQDYRFKVVYRPGRDNEVADQLSRPVRALLYQGGENYLGLSQEEFKQKQLDEPRWADVINYLEGGRLPRKKCPSTLITRFMLYEGLLYLCADKCDNSVQLRLVIPQELRKAALKFGHETVAGHLGRRKSIDAIESHFYWPSLRADVVKYVKECVVCQRHKDSRALQQPFQELPPVKWPLERISLDLTDMVSGANGYRYVLTIIDHYSRYCKFYPLRTKTTDEVSRNFVVYLQDFGIPTCVVLDNGAEFTSLQFKELCKAHNIKLGYITPYHPQGNSLSERMHRTMKTILNVLCQGHPYKWPGYLGETQRVLNTAVHTTLGEQPHFVFFSRRAPRQVTSTLPSLNDGDESAVEKAHEIVQKTHQEMARKYRQLANRNRKSERVEKDALVWVRNETVIPNTSRKLNPKWIGPYRVTEVVRGGAKYRLVNLFDDTVLERAADKVKPYVGQEEWLIEPQALQSLGSDVEDPGLRTRGARNIVPPSRWIEEI